MGQHADDHLDESLQDYWDWEADYEDGSYSAKLSTPKSPTCRYCGLQGLQWVLTSRGWRLFGDSGAHKCKEYRNATG